MEIRTDLASVPFETAGFIGFELLPVVETNQDGGTLNFVKYGTSTAGKRSIGSSVTGKVAELGEVAFTLEQYFDTASIPFERKDLISEVGAVAGAKRGVTLAQEMDIAVAIMDAKTKTAKGAQTIAAQIEAGRVKMLSKSANGKLVLACSASNFALLLADSDIAEKYAKLNCSYNGVDARTAQQAALAMALGVDKVLVGVDEAWNVELDSEGGIGNTDCVALAWIPNTGADVKSVASLGATIAKNTGNGRFVIEQVEDATNRAVRYDVSSYAAPKVLNLGLIEILEIA